MATCSNAGNESRVLKINSLINAKKEAISVVVKAPKHLRITASASTASTLAPFLVTYCMQEVRSTSQVACECFNGGVHLNYGIKMYNINNLCCS